MIKSRLRLSVWAVAVALPLMIAQSAEAATLHCRTGDVQCLIAAIDQANADPHHRTTIHLAPGTYALRDIDNWTNGPNGLPSIASTVTIEAGHEGATLTRGVGAPAFRLLHIGSTGRLTLDGIRLVGGESTFVPSSGNVEPLDVSGGALLNDRGTVTIVNCTFDSNSAFWGGAVFTSFGTLSMSDSTFVNNRADDGGGLGNVGGVARLTRTQFDRNIAGLLGAGGFSTRNGEAHVSQSRFTGNSGHGGAGGMFVGGGTASISDTSFSGNGADPTGALRVDEQGSVIGPDSAFVIVRDSAFVDNSGRSDAAITNRGIVDVINTTFARNTLGNPNGSQVIRNLGRMRVLSSTFAENGNNNRFVVPLPGTVIENSPGATFLLQNTIVVHSSDDVGTQDCGGGGFTSLGNNLISDPAACNLQLQPTDLVGEAHLGALVDDGTPGNAHYPLLPASQAIDAANDAACPEKDQIGQLRRPHCDIGAIAFRHFKPQHDGGVSQIVITGPGIVARD